MSSHQKTTDILITVLKTTKYSPTIPTKLTIVKNTESTAVKRIVVFFLFSIVAKK